MGEKSRKHKVREKRGRSLNQHPESIGTGKRSEDRETLYGIYCHCRRNPEEIAGNGFEDFVELVEETTYNLTETERRRFLKRADGQRSGTIAAEEGCKREAVLGSVRSMICKNDYCRIAAEFGCLRPRKNQHAYTSLPDRLHSKDSCPEDVLADDGCPNFP